MKTLVGTLIALLALPAFAQDEKKSVEVVFVLDTTGSMSGLIEGAKKKIWSIINEIASAKPTPTVKVGFVIYRDKGDEYVTKVFDLTEDLDKAFATLKTFAANGGGDGPEHVNKGLHDGVNQIAWSKDKNVYKVIFLVGDYEPHMDYDDGFDYKKHCKEAVERDIVINTVRCGNNQVCERFWQDIARLGEGKYFSIDQSGGMVSISTPYDKEIGRLAEEIDRTTVARRGREKMKESCDAATVGLSAESKADKGGFYAKSKQAWAQWDLVTDCMDGKVKIEELKDEELPDELRKLSREERKKFVDEKIARRKECQAKIAELEKKRRAFIEEEMKKLSKDKDSFDSAVLKTIKEQGEKKGLKW